MAKKKIRLSKISLLHYWKLFFRGGPGGLGGNSGKGHHKAEGKSDEFAKHSAASIKRE